MFLFWPLWCSQKCKGVTNSGPYPQYGWHFPGEIPEKFRKDSGNALRAFPGIPVESTAGIPQALHLKALEASKAFPELSPPQYDWGRFFFQKWCRRGPLRAGHGIPSSIEGTSEIHMFATCSPGVSRAVWRMPHQGGPCGGVKLGTGIRNPQPIKLVWKVLAVHLQSVPKCTTAS